MRRVLALAKPLRPTMLLAVAAGAATVGCGVALLAVSGFLIARASEHPDEVALALAVVAVRAFGIGRGAFRYVERLASHDAAFRVLADLRVRVYRRLERLTPGHDLRAGDLLSRLVSDVDAVQDLFIRGVTPPAVAAVVGAGATVAAFVISPPAGAVLAAGLLCSGVLVPWCVVRVAATTEHRLAAARGRLAVQVTDLVEGAAELVAFGRQHDAVAAVADTDRSLARLARRAALVTGVGTGLSTLVTGVTVWVVLLLSVTTPLSRVGVAVLVLTALASFEATAPLPLAAQQLTAVRAGAGRVLGVLDAADPVREPAEPAPLPAGAVHLRLQGARLRYGADRPWALDGVDLDLAPGRRVAVVGPSGAGKSTVASVLMRFRDLDAGAAWLDDTPLERFSGDDVRSVVGGCLSDAHVFDSTVRENLRLARPSATQPELDEVAARVRLLDWIDAQPRGWDTPVGAHGDAMSGGERQRLMLARALLADPQVLVLDEPTAHLDPHTRDEVMADLLQATRGRTLLLITHDPTGLEQMDEVIRLDHGRAMISQ